MKLQTIGPVQIVYDVKATIIHLFKRLIHSPALLTYILIGTGVSFWENGIHGIFTSIANIIVLAAFAVLIRAMTEKQSAERPVFRRPKLELLIGLALVMALFFAIMLIFNLTSIPVIQPAVTQLISTLKLSAYSFGNHILPEWIARKTVNAIITIVIELIPTIILFVAFGYGPKAMGLIPCYWLLTGILILCGVVMTPISGQPVLLFQQPIHQTLFIFLFDIFINGLPEELLFRGLLLPRFETIFKNPVNALVVTSLIFNAIHIPSHISGGVGTATAIIGAFSISFPSGVLWGYLYQRSRSVIPGVLFHTSYSILGAYFFHL